MKVMIHVASLWGKSWILTTCHLLKLIRDSLGTLNDEVKSTTKHVRTLDFGSGFPFRARSPRCAP